MSYGPMGGKGGGIWCQQPIRDLYRVPGAISLNHIEYGVVRCGVMGHIPYRSEKKKGACPVVRGHLFSEFYTRPGISATPRCFGWPIVSMTVPSDFSTGQLTEPVALQKKLFT